MRGEWTHGQFFTALLQQLDLPVQDAGLRSLACVSIFESDQGNERWFNPLACEQDWPDATDYNSAGVKRYRTFADGVQAEAKLLSGPHWNDVRTALRINTSRGPILDAFSAGYTWATIDFRTVSFNDANTLDVRLSHVLH